MISIKNKELNKKSTTKLCKIHNDNNNSKEKLRLYAFRNPKFIKTYHPLKQKKVKLKNVKFISERNIQNIFLKNKEIQECSGILSKKYTIMPQKIAEIKSEWATENSVVEWLTSIGIEIKKISTTQYFLRNRICLFNNVLIFANRKRVEMGLHPFYINGIIEY